jgi:peptidyl-prolyl cis-trans isomerase C
MFRRSVVPVFVAALGVCCTCWAQAPADTESVVLTVNGSPVSAAQLRLAMQSMASQLQRTGQQVDDQRLMDAATEQVVGLRLLAQEARRRELSIDAAELDGIMGQIDQQSGGRDALTESLTASGVPYDTLRNAVEESELAQRLIDTTVRPGLQVTDDEDQAFYTSNPQNFQAPEQVRARHVLVKVGQEAGEQEREQARARADDVRQRAVAGEDFAGLARELSEGPSADQGGDLGFFSEGQMVQPFSDAAFALQPGEISEVVETRFGFHVIKVEERRAAGVRPLDEVREPLRNALLERKVEAGVAELVESLRAKAEIVPSQPAGVQHGEEDAG